MLPWTNGRSVESSNGAALFHLHGGKVARLVIYTNRERALADLGLAPEAGAATSP